MVAVIDIDGTIFNTLARQEACSSITGDEPFSTERWYECFTDPDGLSLDVQVRDAGMTIEVLAKKFTVIYLTGRPERMRVATTQQLEEFRFPLSISLIMQKDEESQFPENTLKFKQKELEKILKFLPIDVLVDDRSDIVTMAKKMGICSFRVPPWKRVLTWAWRS